jgi:hypothetical protein
VSHDHAAGKQPTEEVEANDDSSTDAEQASGDDAPEARADDSDPTASSEKAAGGKHPSGGKSRTSSTEAAEAAIRDVVNNYFVGDVSAGTIGLGRGEASANRRRRATGKLTADEAAEVTNRYARPGCYAGAVSALMSKHVVVLEGPSGTGRRAGAVSLLREMTAGSLVSLSPLITVNELAERKYQGGTGYLVADRTTERHTADVGVSWSNVRDRVQESGAYLVVTTASVAAGAASRAVPHVPWERAPDHAVLQAQLLGLGYLAAGVDEVVDQLVTDLPQECPLARLVDLAELVGGEGVCPAEALARLGEKAGREVPSWFGRSPSLHEVLEVTALCFLEGVDLRTFEMLLGRLQGTAAARLPGQAAKALRKSVDPLGDRCGRVDGHDLIAMRDIRDGARISQVLVFREEAYRGAVLEQLWRSRPAKFWDSVAEWLDGVVADCDALLPVARGLAQFARVNYDEVEHLYLNRWSWGELGPRGKITAVYALWFASHIDQLAPPTLRTAVRWAADRDVDRRWTALVAFAGDLGVCYPTDAANRIWQLTAQSNDLCAEGCRALACLFATLADETPEAAHVVLTLLDLKTTKFGSSATSQSRMHASDLQRIRGLTMSAALAVLSASSTHTNRSAVFEYLHCCPDRTSLVTRIWAALLTFRPLRRDALVTLHRGLHQLRDISDEPLAAAAEIGAALSAALPVSERTAFADDFRVVDRQLRRGSTETPAEILLACLDAMTRSTPRKGTQ